MNRELKFQFIIDHKHLSKPYSLDEILNIDEDSIIEDMESCDCSLNESINHCEGDCLKFENSIITGKRQFTGLNINIKGDGFNEKGDYKTKNPLYEHDIVEFKSSTKFTLGYEVKGEKYVVCYQAELGGGFVLKHVSVFKKQNGCNEIIDNWRVIDPYQMSNLKNHFEPVGNIHSNPELINQP